MLKSPVDFIRHCCLISRELPRIALAMLSGAIFFGFSPTVDAANYPLELVSPRQAGTVPAAGSVTMPAGHRIFRAYPGIAYNIRAVVVGGAYPYTFELSNAPTGMSINAATGEINWPNPTGATVTPTITVTDSEGARTSSPWTITVTTEGFRFVSPTGNDSAAGTIDAPWRTMLKVYNSAVAADIVYWRTGTYTSDGIPRQSVGSAWERVDFGTSKSARWIAYPGERPVFNFGYVAGVDPSAIIRFTVNAAYPIWLDGLEGYNFRNIGFQIVSGSHFLTIRRLKVRDMIRGVDGENPGGIMFTAAYTGIGWYAAVQDSEFYNLNMGGGLKIYSQGKMVIEDNVFRDSTEGFDLKSHISRFDVRRNTFRNISSRTLYGNMHENSGDPVIGEIRYNNFNTPGASVSLDVNTDGMARDVYIYRNTIVGKAQVRWADATNGPFYFSNNVIVNNDTESAATDHISLYNSQASRVIRTDNLAGTPSLGIIDSNGMLTSAYQRYVGTHGHQIGDPPERPNPPTGVAVE